MLLWPGLRMILQLTVLGFVLEALFSLRSGVLVLLMLLVMAGFAVQTVVSRLQRRFPGVYRSVTIAILIGCGGATVYFCHLVIGLDPWYSPQYLIPLAGMVFGNSMTGASLAAERLVNDLVHRREEIEAALCLGASPRQACSEFLKGAFYAAMIPTINAMAAMGLVFIPGMMTGQILSGVSPFVAVSYQVAIMCVITFSVAASSLLILEFGYRSCFTSSWQLKVID
jgi:putative ABC transport system permease protein